MGKFESELLGVTLVTSENRDGLTMLTIDGPDDTLQLLCSEHALRELRRELTKAGQITKAEQ